MATKLQKKVFENVGWTALLLPPRPVPPSRQAPVPGAPAAAAGVALEPSATIRRSAVKARTGRAPAGHRSGSTPGVMQVLRRSVVLVAPISGTGSVVAGVVRPGPRIPGTVPWGFAVAGRAGIRRAGSGRSTGSGSGLVASLPLP